LAKYLKSYNIDPRKECGQIYVKMVDWEYDEKCETSYEEVCHGYGYEKKCDQVTML
jgi:hypothetical protein